MFFSKEKEDLSSIENLFHYDSAKHRKSSKWNTVLKVGVVVIGLHLIGVGNTMWDFAQYCADFQNIEQATDKHLKKFDQFVATKDYKNASHEFYVIASQNRIFTDATILKKAKEITKDKNYPNNFKNDIVDISLKVGGEGYNQEHQKISTTLCHWSNTLCHVTVGSLQTDALSLLADEKSKIAKTKSELLGLTLLHIR